MRKRKFLIIHRYGQAEACAETLSNGLRSAFVPGKAKNALAIFATNLIVQPKHSRGPFTLIAGTPAAEKGVSK